MALETDGAEEVGEKFLNFRKKCEKYLSILRIFKKFLFFLKIS